MRAWQGIAVTLLIGCSSRPPVDAGVVPARQTVTAVLRVADVGAAMSFYARAFGARQRLVLTSESGVIEHAEASIAGVALWIDRQRPGAEAGTSGGVIVGVERPELRLRELVALGGTALGGDAYRDPFGHVWRLRRRVVGEPALVPFLVIDASSGAGFYERAFGARVVASGVDIRGSRVELELAGRDQALRTPRSMGGAPFRVHVYVADATAAYRQALDAGAVGLVEPTVMHWGDRWALVGDPSGHTIGIGERLESLTASEITRRMRAAR